MSNQELHSVSGLFTDRVPVDCEIVNTSHGESDFREVIIARFADDSKLVIKLSDNDFTFPEKIKIWQRCAEEYRRLGYYCPAILPSLNGDFPTVRYKGHDCIAYAEECSLYKSVLERDSEDNCMLYASGYMDEAVIMTAKVAAQQFDFSEYPSGYCLFERFCPSDKADEVLEVAMKWKEYADLLPSQFSEQVQRIWGRWLENRSELEKIYPLLPTSVFQADLNATNLLADENGNFKGMFDFNICGRDVFLNYLFRELCCEIPKILHALDICRPYYRFSEIERAAATPLYRCLAPLWHTLDDPQKTSMDNTQIQARLDNIERLQNTTIEIPI